MGRWTDIATWVGPTPNQGGRMSEQRGVVVHTAVGSFEGTKAWQRNPDANVSSHFIVAYDGRIAQMVDTDVVAWTQKAGNGHWLSIENEGDTTKPLTPAQVAANGRILRKAHQVYGVPLQLATSPSGRGLGHHSMGAESGVDWGHSACPGAKIKAQKPAILAAAKGEDDVSYLDEKQGAVFNNRTGAQIIGDIWFLLVKGNQGTWLHQALVKLGVDITADGVDEQAVAAAILAVLTPQAIAAAVPDELAREVADELAARLAT